jgi:nickel-dependent lactate racemase
VIVKLPYGQKTVALDLRGLRVHALRPTAPQVRKSARDLAEEALDHPLDAKPLTELARGRRTATVIVPDATRRAALPEVLPAVLARIQRAGIERSSITILVACGTHPAVGRESLEHHLGPVPHDLNVIEHDSRDAQALVAVGELRPGVPLRLNRRAVECDLLVTVGTVRHHYFAGFGGGPKMVFPGVGGFEEIQANHALVLRREGKMIVREPNCEPGVLGGNPVAEEIAAAGDLRSPDCALCLVENADGGLLWAGAGPWRATTEVAIEHLRSWFEVPAGPTFDLMVACGGGDPSDATLIQAHKGLDAACRFLAPGGELLFFANLGGGAGSPDMGPFLADPRSEAILGLLEARWVQYGHTTLRLVEKTARHRVRLHSYLDFELAERLGFLPTQEPEAVVDSWRSLHPGATVGVMDSGPVYLHTPS